MKAAEVAKDTNNDWFNLIFENKMTGIIIVSLDGSFIRVNETYCKITGYSTEECSSLSVYDITPENEHDLCRRMLEKVFKGNRENFEFEKKIITKTGKVKWVEIKGSLIGQQTDSLLVFVADIDEKKRTAEALKKSAYELRLAQEVANIGSWFIDMRTGNIKWSDEMYAILGMKKDEKPLGWKIAELLHPDDRAIFNEKMGTLKEYSDLEVRYVARGKLLTLKINARVLYENGEAIKYYGTVQDITEARKLEHRIQDAQRIAKLGWWEYDLEKGEALWSDSIYKIIGIEKRKKPLTSNDLFEILHPDDLKWMNDILDDLQDGWSNKILRYKRKDGGYAHVLSSGEIIFDREKPVKLVGTNMDVSETIEVQNKLREVQKIAKVAWYEYDLCDPNNHKVSKELMDLMETPMPEGTVDAQKYINMLVPTDKKDFEYKVNNVEEFPNGWDNQVFRIATKSGRLKYVAGSARIAYENGTPIRIFGSVYDITKIKEYEQVLAENQINLQALITSMENIVFVINDQMKFERVFCNDPDLLHIPAEDFLGNSIYEIWDNGPGKNIAQLVERAFKENEEGFHSYKYTPHAKEYWWDAYIKPVKGKNYNRVAVIINDITTRKAAEEEMIKSVKREKELSEMRTQFVSMASHQFRTPLTVIKSNMELLDLSGISHPIIGKVTKRLNSETDRLLALMEDVMTMGKAQSDHLELKWEYTKMSDIVRRVKMNIERTITDSRSMELTISGIEKEVRVDVTFMEHALNNLIENAFKYSPGNINPEILLAYTTKKLKIFIKDYGLGIPKTERNRLFSAFHRCSNTHHIPGTGLGLAIAKEFVTLNHGSLFLNEKQEKGTEFCIVLPLEK